MRKMQCLIYFRRYTCAEILHQGLNLICTYSETASCIEMWRSKRSCIHSRTLIHSLIEKVFVKNESIRHNKIFFCFSFYSHSILHSKSRSLYLSLSLSLFLYLSLSFSLSFFLALFLSLSLSAVHKVYLLKRRDLWLCVMSVIAIINETWISLFLFLSHTHSLSHSLTHSAPVSSTKGSSTVLLIFRANKKYLSPKWALSKLNWVKHFQFFSTCVILQTLQAFEFIKMKWG